MRENNSGFSLLELVVTLAIVAIVGGAVLSFAVMSSDTYRRQNREVEMQYEAQLATNQLQELLVDATKGVSYFVSGSEGSAYLYDDSEIDATTIGVVSGKELGIYNNDIYYIVTWNPTAKQLLYSEYHRKVDGSWEANPDPNNVLMADYVKDFSIDLSDMDKNGSVCLKLVYNKDKDYEVIQNVFLRNKVAVNKTVAEMY